MNKFLFLLIIVVGVILSSLAPLMPSLLAYIVGALYGIAVTHFLWWYA
jgi:hypothetical protein